MTVTDKAANDIHQDDGAAAYGQQRFSLKTYVPYHLSRCASIIGHIIVGEIEQKFGLLPSEWRILNIVVEYAPLSTRELTARTSLEKALVSRTTAALVERGLVNKFVDPSDRRLLILRASRKGLLLHQKTSACAIEIETELLGGLGEKDVAALVGLLKHLKKSALAYVNANPSPRTKRYVDGELGD
ncbi:MarR family winged helix-turn-helix transcriptional regulator [Paraburkholderia tropica]|uniref:MarR family winged helix-turn-helix transcriptional regulator n=1 Tax=Paraburkholderia tropica TaxID=92647 RepID=UPI002AB60AF2|nr:MarR family transcriptional regulator [Paraburkholderia tropica]